ncbi:hypothetical protein RHSIM_Rhsim09G0201300 [Rhododendron simsii]|uniref:Trafficking protein particle complex subunit n=1 Tax=Rhododendron simsii TaxID=118357 RepID=A0A834GGS9_RHOSS|nr:hypothetical protein RHSIM_Rhsim09G0201300 [Rhododendron simsii]
MQFFGGSEISPSPPLPTASGNNGHMMYVFNRNGICLLYREWNRPLHTLNAQQDHKLMFGLLFSLKSLTAKMDPTSVDKGNLGVPQLPGQGCSFHSFRTNTYKLSFMESPSGIKIILVTHPRTGDLRESLKYIYNLYVEYVVKNPLYTPGTPIRCELFDSTLDQYFRSHLIHMVELAKLMVAHHPSFPVTILITTATKPDNSTATDNQSRLIHHSCHHLPPPPSPDSTL